MNTTDNSGIEAFEMKRLRHFLRASWTERQKITGFSKKPVYQLLSSTKTRKLQYFRHFMRQICLEKDIIPLISNQAFEFEMWTSWHRVSL